MAGAAVVEGGDVRCCTGGHEQMDAVRTASVVAITHGGAVERGPARDAISRIDVSTSLDENSRAFYIAPEARDVERRLAHPILDVW